MGNDASAGYGIINETEYKVTLGASMGATYYYENNVMPGQIWYRRPGAVYMTIYAFPSEGNEIHKKSVAIEHVKVWGTSILAAVFAYQALAASPFFAGTAAGASTAAATLSTEAKVLAAISAMSPAEAAMLLGAVKIMSSCAQVN